MPRITEEECVKKLTQAIDRHTGIAPAFAEQMAEMLVGYYGVPAFHWEDGVIEAIEKVRPNDCLDVDILAFLSDIRDDG